MISEDEMGKVQSLLNKFTEIAKTINGMESVDEDITYLKSRQYLL